MEVGAEEPSEAPCAKPGDPIGFACVPHVGHVQENCGSHHVTGVSSHQVEVEINDSEVVGFRTEYPTMTSTSNSRN